MKENRYLHSRFSVNGGKLITSAVLDIYCEVDLIWLLAVEIFANSKTGKDDSHIDGLMTLKQHVCHSHSKCKVFKQS